MRKIIKSVVDDQLLVCFEGISSTFPFSGFANNAHWIDEVFGKKLEKNSY